MSNALSRLLDLLPKTPEFIATVQSADHPNYKVLVVDGTGLVQISKRIERGKFMSRLELGEINEITLLEFKQVFNGGLIVRPKVERSFYTNKSITQPGPGLQAGFNQSNLNHA